jgi:hypothetical protein
MHTYEANEKPTESAIWKYLIECYNVSSCHDFEVPTVRFKLGLRRLGSSLNQNQIYKAVEPSSVMIGCEPKDSLNSVRE